MKLRPEHAQELRDAIAPVLAANPGARAEYVKLGRTMRRYRWDVLHASGYNTTAIYKYANDEHIDTVLRRVCGD